MLSTHILKSNLTKYSPSHICLTFISKNILNYGKTYVFIKEKKYIKEENLYFS